ncbi:alcohol dehydrogenase [Microbacterium sp. X-17]|uniref:alcohol dehydrogenase n=1 Tax=Microbacterium sp. X-17 TaxID=3144404 RepID=UPI0031F5D9AB
MHAWAVVEAKQPLEWVELETPEPQGTEVVVDVTHCGVCHSDVHFWEGEYNLGYGKVVKLLDRGVTLPRAPGHEVVGVVSAVGPDAEGVSVGDQRIVFPWIGCGHCARCLAGDDNMCASAANLGVVRHGGFATQVTVPHPRYLVDFGGIDPSVAATYACSGVTVFSSIRKLEIADPDAPVLLIGAGGLGRSAVAMLRGIGHRNIIVSDIDPTKERDLLAAGVSAYVDARTEDLSGAIIAAAGGPLMYAIDFVNRTSTANAAFNALAQGGRLVLVGLAGGEMELPLAQMVFTRRAILGNGVGTLRDLEQVLSLAHAGALEPIPIVHMGHDKANEALQLVRQGAVAGRIVLTQTGKES